MLTILPFTMMTLTCYHLKARYCIKLWLLKIWNVLKAITLTQSSIVLLCCGTLFRHSHRFWTVNSCLIYWIQPAGKTLLILHLSEFKHNYPHIHFPIYIYTHTHTNSSCNPLVAPFKNSSDSTFLVCSHTFTLSWLRNMAMIVKIF